MSFLGLLLLLLLPALLTSFVPLAPQPHLLSPPASRKTSHPLQPVPLLPRPSLLLLASPAPPSSSILSKFIALPLPLILVAFGVLGFATPLPFMLPLPGLSFDIFLPLAVCSSLLSAPSSSASSPPPSTPKPSQLSLYVSFFVASLASIFASTVIHHTLRPPLAISTILLASYVGGAVNMLALARMLEVPSATTSMYCAVDCGVMLIYLALVEWLHATLLLARAIGSAFNAVAPAAVPRTVTAQSTVLSLVALGSYFKDRVPAKRKKELVVFSQLTSQLFYSAVALSLGASRSDLRAFPYLVVGGLQLLHVLVMFFAVLAKRSWATQLLLASNAAIGGAGTAALFAANVQKPELVEDGVRLGVFSYLVGGFTAVAWASFLQ